MLNTDDSGARKLIEDYLMKLGLTGQTKVNPLNVAFDLDLPFEQVLRVGMDIPGVVETED